MANKITVTSAGTVVNANVTPDSAMYYSNKSKEWAISEKLIDNEDYSSKYYANESKKQADISTAKATEVVESGNTAVSNIESARDNAIIDITNQESLSVDNVNTAGTTQVSSVNTAGITQVANVNSAGTTQVNLAKEQVTLATNQANIATEQATIATNKTSEVVASGNEALANITTAKNNAITSITNQETTSKNVLIDEGATQVGLIQNEGATQIANVQSTGFYMRDDKLYYINSQGEETEFKSGGSGLEICDIGMALYVDETKGLRRYLNGQIVDRNANTEAFFTRLQEITTLHPSLLCTEEEWQTAKTMSAFGQVGKFVFNYSGENIVSVRLPRVVNVQGLFDLQNLGMTVGAGLPNIIYNDYRVTHDIAAQQATGALVSTARGNYAAQVGATLQWRDLSFNASRSNPIYGNSDTVQPEAIQYPYFIQIATGSETENNIINEIELNNPYSLFDSKYSDHELNNLSWLKSEGQWNAKAVYTDAYDKLLKIYNGTETVEGLSVKLSTETYTDYDFVLNTANETFRLPLKNHTADDGKSVLTLYFYVGETVQNANLIDAGRIGEQVTSLIPNNSSLISGYGMPSDKYINLTLGASGSTYTAPANGWVIFTVQGQGFCNLEQGSIIVYNAFSEAGSNYYSVLLPVRKGTFKAYYNGVTKITFRFVYAVGSEPST